MMDRVMVNITWRCNLGDCPYCWVNQVVRCNEPLWTAKNHVAAEWVAALNTLDPAIFDFVGGEPLAFPNFAEVVTGLDPKHGYAVTSNLHHDRGLDEFVACVGGTRCLCFTGSYHPSGKLTADEFGARLKRIQQAGVGTSINIIDHPSIPDAKKIAAYLRVRWGMPAAANPYEHPSDLETPNDVTLTCNGGLTHYVINNDGRVYPCLSWFRYSGRDERCMGNVFDGTFQKYRERQRCRLRCEMHYVVDKSNSMVADLQIKEEA